MAAKASMERLGLEYLDLYLIHQPFGDYYGAWRAMEEMYRDGIIQAIGVCNFDEARLVDLCINHEILPAVNQIEIHPFHQQTSAIQTMNRYKVQPEAWGPLSEGQRNIFQHRLLRQIADRYEKSTAQIILRWHIQQGIIVIPKSARKERMEENLDIWDFSLGEEDMAKIAALDKGCPSMLDTRKISEIRRVYDYLDNPVLTSL